MLLGPSRRHCSHGRQQGVDPGEQRADSFHSKTCSTRATRPFHTELFYPSTSLPRAEELDEKVTIADLQFERQARDRASRPRPSRRVLRGPPYSGTQFLKLPRLSVSAHAPWSSCVSCRMCPLLRRADVETVVSEIDVIVSSTGSFNIISFECFHWKHRTL